MTDIVNRPVPPKQSLEEQLRQAVENARSKPDGMQRLPAGDGAYDAELSRLRSKNPGAQRVMPTAQVITARLAHALDRLRKISAQADAIASVLAGPQPYGAAAGEQEPPASSLFVIYERTLDEMDRVLDSIDIEQARTRSILSD